MNANVLQLQEVGDFGDENCLPTQNPAGAGHKASFNPDPSGNRQFLIGAVLVAQLIHTAIIVLNILCTKMLLNVHKCLYVKYIQDFRLYLYHARAQRHSTQNDVPGKYQ